MSNYIRSVINLEPIPLGAAPSHFAAVRCSESSCTSMYTPVPALRATTNCFGSPTYRDRFLALILGLAACSGAATETQRTSNPSRTLDAVIAARKTLATAFPPTEIYVLPKGGDISSPPAFVADGVVGLRVTWESESELTIHAEKARIFISEPSVEVQSSDRPHPTLVKIGLNIRGSK